ncbi:branched-chain amino acid ABC transporter ATP-binding protein/permease [Achromobacter veterisilvae]|uniref:Branched-chain amino acid ABC transporter ATP-binding protein/permease n=1 Tax=Achromobacter veterisilvae TaxID=2069367 RepID=A0A446CGC2_9BURK|nr:MULTISPECIES: branched-chain amino acid ABC transporter ATP-binding protein/permease [Achromobacter]MCW0208362.1 branched-chain amino acid ABC transporter ATP-binding protein/permease [Achromobacter sp.]SSW66871.1 Galactose/methyl galactoside import ATP-binding protein MglA [Achromobacter veterisilvae]
MSAAQTQAQPAPRPRGSLRPGAVVVAALLAVLALVLNNDFYLRIMFMCGVYYLCAAGMNVLAGYAGQKSLGQAGLFAAGAYAVALLTTRWEWHPALALAAAPVVAAGVGLLIALPSLRVKGPSLALVTLAFGIVAEKLVTEWTDVFGGAQGIYGIAPLAIAQTPFSLQQWVWLVIGLSLAVHLALARAFRGRFGRALLSLQFDEIAAACSGIAVYRYKTLAFMVAAALCGLGGALVAQQNQYFNSDFITFHLSVFILLLVLLGGAGTIYGPLAGAVVLTLAEVFLAQWPFAQHFVYGGMLLFALYLMPRGIVGLFDRWRPAPPELPAAPNGAELPVRPVAKGVPLLQLSGICKNFGGVVTAQDVNLVLEPQRIHALIGPNGAGKSTLINILTGVIPPTAGTLTLQGRDMTRAGAHRLAAAGVARTFQNLRLFGAMSVLDNVLVGAHSRLGQGVPEAQARQEVMAVLAFTGLLAHAQARAGSLPYGVQRRVELARALASRPALLLLDEPAAGLNPQETRELGQLVRRIGALGVAVLMVEHDMSLVMNISDHIVVLDRGLVIAEGNPKEIQSNPRVIEAYLGSDAGLEE